MHVCTYLCECMYTERVTEILNLSLFLCKIEIVSLYWLRIFQMQVKKAELIRKPIGVRCNWITGSSSNVVKFLLLISFIVYLSSVCSFHSLIMPLDSVRELISDGPNSNAIYIVIYGNERVYLSNPGRKTHN